MSNQEFAVELGKKTAELAEAICKYVATGAYDDDRLMAMCAYHAVLCREIERKRVASADINARLDRLTIKLMAVLDDVEVLKMRMESWTTGDTSASRAD